MPTKQNILYSDQIISDSIMMNIQSKLTISNFAKLDEIIMKTSTTFIGVFIDEFLTWENHMNHISISRAIFMIKQVKILLPTESLKTLYYTIVHAYLTYVILAWSNATQANLKKQTICKRGSYV